MPQAMWTGYLSFGLVSVPVALYSASQDRSIRFNQLHKGTTHRVRYRKVDEVTGEELSSGDIVRGFAVEGGDYVVIEDSELRELAPGRSELIDVTDFVELKEIDPVYFQKTYYLAPRNASAEKAYALLCEAMAREAKVGIATFVMRDKQYLVAIRPNERALILETLAFSDEIRPAHSVLPDFSLTRDFTERELEMAGQLIGSMSTVWDPSRYHDTYRERVLALVEAKRAGRPPAPAEAEPQANVLDLVAALEASVARARGARPASERPARRRDAPARAEQQTFSGMSRAELLALAAERDVQGRTKMTKLQLVKALTDAEAAQAARPAGRGRAAG